MRKRPEAYRVLVASLLAYSLSASFARPIFAQDQANQFQPSVVLPRPEPKFQGRIGTTYKDSEPDKIPIVTAPEGAPNVLLILIDDCGYGQWRTWFTQARYRVTGAEKLPPGPATIRLEFKYDGGGIGKGGMATLFVNDKKVGEGRIEKTIPARYSLDETFDVGMDTASPVSDDYDSPFSFAGTLKKVEIDVAPANLSASDREVIRRAGQDCEMAAE